MNFAARTRTLVSVSVQTTKRYTCYLLILTDPMNRGESPYGRSPALVLVQKEFSNHALMVKFTKSLYYLY